MAAHRGHPQRLGVADELAQHAAPGGQRSDGAAPLLVDSPGQEPCQLVARLVQDAEGGVPGAGQLARGVKHTLEHLVGVELLEHAARDCEDPSRRLIHRLLLPVFAAAPPRATIHPRRPA